MRFGNDLENTTSSLLRNLEFEKCAWRLGGASNVTEAKSFYLSMDDGSTLIFQIAFTNIAWPSNWFQVNSHYLPFSLNSLQDKSIIAHCDNVSPIWVKISKDKMSIAASSGTMHLNTLADIRIKLKCGKMKFDFVLEECIGLVTLDDGTIHVPDEGQIQMSFLPCLKGEGEFQIQDNQSKRVKVQGIGIFQWQGVKVHRCASQWKLGWFFSSKFQSISMQMIGTKRQDFQTISLNILVQNNVIILACNECHFPTLEAQKSQTERLKLVGVNNNGSKAEILIHADNLSQITRIKVLDSLPFVLRKMLQTFMPCPVISHYKSVNAQINGLDVEGTFLYEESIVHK